ncbi:aldo/keto reductase [Actinoplanes sp. CA-030573]|uniref:aldo/keto reductase n=1 Tax=Actinoplanes sp. CA-030573 TaxID=3239898 RepID=UPI003D8FB726
MRYRTLGSSGLRVSELILGAMTFGEQGGVGAPLEECRKILDAYEEAGGNTVDTAINYRDGQSEEFLGQLLSGRRESFVLSSKYTSTRNADDPNGGGNARKNLRASLETSLRRLRTDYLDLYWVHVWDRSTPIEETMRALDDAVRAGKVLYVGISDAPAWVVSRGQTLAEWHGWSPFTALQVPYNVIDRDIERELLPMAESLGIGVTAWSPLAGGILSGKYTQAGGVAGPSRHDPASLTEPQRAAAVAVQAVADEIGATPSQVAIAWTAARSKAVVPIIGARSLEQVLDNLGATEVRLTREQIDRLAAATDFTRGFPHDFIDNIAHWVFGKGLISEETE